MMNHSLVKLTLFLLAGVVYCNTHALDLNQIRGFGRGKPLLHILFLCGACSLAGIPGFLGYISKTLVHESLVELAAESGSLGVTAVEWLFLFSGGLTAAYLTKIYAALFWQKPAASTGRTWGTPATTAALILAALPLPVLGLLPHMLAEPVAALALPFVGGHPFGHAVHYLAWENLKGVAISLTIGMAVYFLFIRLVLMDRREGQVVYLERWPRWLSLEDRVYRPAIRGLPSPPPEIPPQRRAPRHDPRRTAHGAGGRRPAGHHPGHHPPDGGQPVLCPADGLPGIVHCPGVHPAVRFLIAKELPQPRGSSFVCAGNSCICPVGVIYCYIDMIAFRGRVPP